MLLFLFVSGDFGVVEHGVDGGDCGDAQGDCLECQYAPAEVSGRVQFLDRAKGLDVPRQATGPVDHRDQGSRTNYFFKKKIAKTSLREFFIKKTQKALNVIHNNSIIP